MHMTGSSVYLATGVVYLSYAVQLLHSNLSPVLNAEPVAELVLCIPSSTTYNCLDSVQSNAQVLRMVVLTL